MIQNQQSEIDESDFKDWLNHPITIEIFSVFKENQELIKENILSLDPIGDPAINKKNAYLRGSLEICEKFLSLTFEDLLKKEEEKSEDEETPYAW